MSLKTQRLYHEDPTLRTFEARVLETRAGDDGVFEIVLDRTAFYPTGGGQPHDLGTLGQFEVADVLESGDAVVHRVRGSREAGLPVGEVVQGNVDWARRSDHRQQHTGQHILSRALLVSAGAATVGFHLGEARATIDLDRADLDEAALDRAEDQANAVILDDVPVDVSWYGSAADLPPGLRREVEVEGPIRVVSVGDFDRSACCGTHCSRSGEVGPVKILRMEKKKGGTRIEFVCGSRALADHRVRHRALRDAALLLTTGDLELPERVAALRDELKESRARLARTEDDLLERLLEAWSGAPAGPLVVDVGPGRASWLPRAVAALVDRRRSAVLAHALDGDLVRVAAGQAGGHAGNQFKELLAEAGGRGGGSERLGQGQVPPTGLAPLIEAWLRRVALGNDA